MNSPRSASAHRNFGAVRQDKIRPRPVKAPGRLVGVIADRTALTQATRLPHPPDLFELRLDALRAWTEEIESVISRLRAPLILTARHPAEGGCGALSAAARRGLLKRFLQHGVFLDVELRSIDGMPSLLAEARRHKIGLIISCHDLRSTPAPEVLHNRLRSAMRHRPDIFKIATRTDTAAQCHRLITFFTANTVTIPIAAMGMGKLGAASRRQLLRLGSALNYAAVGLPNAAGQSSLSELRRARRAYII